MKRPVTDEAVLEDILKPRERKRPIPNPALARFLDELDERRAKLTDSSEDFAQANDRLEASLKGRR